jgi:phasin family protein
VQDMMGTWNGVSLAMLIPMLRFNEVAAGTMERLAREQLGLVRELAETGANQLQEMNGNGGVAELWERQAALANITMGKCMNCSQRSLEILLQAQSELAEVVGRGAAELSRETLRAGEATVENSVQNIRSAGSENTRPKRASSASKD